MAGFVSTPAITPKVSFELSRAGIDPKAVASAKARAAAQDFEAVFLNSMVSQMFTAIGGEGPFGGGAGAGIWRSFLSEEYSPDRVAPRCGIEPHTIRRIAAELAAAAFDNEFSLDVAWMDWAGRFHDGPRYVDE